MESERFGDAVVFRAGHGEWYNQPHSRRWDMGEDVQDLAPAPWHVALEEAITASTPRPRAVIVDVLEMTWLVGQDWGFLAELAARLREENIRLVVVANPRVARSVTALGLEVLIETRASVAEALQGAGE